VLRCAVCVVGRVLRRLLCFPQLWWVVWRGEISVVWRELGCEVWREGCGGTQVSADRDGTSFCRDEWSEESRLCSDLSGSVLTRGVLSTSDARSGE